MAFACRPRVIVLDEPTTGLDVTTQAHVLATVRELAAAARRRGALRQPRPGRGRHARWPRVAVMYAGRIVELGPAEELFDSAAHPYTRRLVAAIPHLSGRPGAGRHPGPRALAGQPAARLLLRPALHVRPARVRDGAARSADDRRRRTRAVHPRGGGARPGRAGARRAPTTSPPPTPASRCSRSAASTPAYGDRRSCTTSTSRLSPRECLALVGESGSGKTTLARSIAGPAPASGRARSCCAGTPLARAGPRPAARRRGATIQYVFQNPYGSLNPRRTVGQIVRQPLDLVRRRRRTPTRRSARCSSGCR